MSERRIIRLDGVPTLQGFALVYEGSPEHFELLAAASASVAEPAADPPAPKKTRRGK